MGLKTEATGPLAEPALFEVVVVPLIVVVVIDRLCTFILEAMKTIGGGGGGT